MHQNHVAKSWDISITYASYVIIQTSEIIHTSETAVNIWASVRHCFLPVLTVAFIVGALLISSPSATALGFGSTTPTKHQMTQLH